MKKSIFIPIEKGGDSARRLIVGTAIAEVVDSQDEVMDYESSKPYIKAWSDKYSESTGGASKGNLRVMHTRTVAGSLTDLGFNDADKALPVVAHVADEDAWAKCESKAYTGFSFGGRTVGPRWLDEDLTSKHGRPIHRYTLRPTELSLVDAPRVPGANIDDVLKGEIDEEEDDMDGDKPETAEAPITAPEVVEESAPVEKGIYTAASLQQIVQDLAWHKEQMETNHAECSEELEMAIKAFAPIVIKYASDVVREIAGISAEPAEMEVEKSKGEPEAEVQKGEIFDAESFRASLLADVRGIVTEAMASAIVQKGEIPTEVHIPVLTPILREDDGVEVRKGKDVFDKIADRLRNNPEDASLALIQAQRGTLKI